MKKKLSILIALVMAISLCLVPAMALAEAAGTVTLIDPVNATITRADTLDEVTFHIEILSENVPHDVYGVAIAFATSLDQPDFHVTYQEDKGADADWYYVDYGVDGWSTGWADPIRGAELILAGTEITVIGEGAPAPGEKVFSMTIPTAVLGGPGATYYYAIQVRTNVIGWYPVDPSYDWGPDVTAFAEATIPNVETEVMEPLIQISMNPNSFDFGQVYPGKSSLIETLSIQNTGSVDVNVLASSPSPFYTDNLRIDDGLLSGWLLPNLLSGDPIDTGETRGVKLQVVLPSDISPGIEVGTIIFWAEATP